MNQASPPKIITNQFVQRHPKYSAANPPITGPVTGLDKAVSIGHSVLTLLSYPFIGPKDQIENASGRHCSVTISATDPGALLIKAAPAQALKIISIQTPKAGGYLAYPRNRTTKTSAKEVAKAHGKTINVKKATLPM